jgi:tRNA pseudouridine55 synthase
MGRPRRRGRDINGIVLLDKPTGMSSNDALQKVKRIYGANKAGHTGALDPLATGMLPICLGEATKFSQFLLDSDKRYRVIAKLGERTDTSDSEGQVISRRDVDCTLADIEAALIHFRGKIKQVPSMYSALKHQGRPLYEYARQGIEVPREARDIEVYQLTLIRFSDDQLELEIHCSKGTYIRTIVDDLGERLGCGAHVVYLRRSEVADYPAERMVTLTQLQSLQAQAQLPESADYCELDRLLMPMDSAVLDFAEVNLPPAIAAYVKQGQPVQFPSAPADGMVRITVGDERIFIGMGEIDELGRVAPRRLVVESSVD